MPVNATAETFLLTRELARRLERRRVAVPVFIAPSAADPILGASDSVLCTVQENRRRFAHLRATSVCSFQWPCLFRSGSCPPR